MGQKIKQKNKITYEFNDLIDVYQNCLSEDDRICLDKLLDEELNVISKLDKDSEYHQKKLNNVNRLLDMENNKDRPNTGEIYQLKMMREEFSSIVKENNIEKLDLTKNLNPYKEMSSELDNLDNLIEMMQEYYKIQQIIIEEKGLESRIKTSGFSGLEGIENRLNQLNTSFIASGMKQTIISNSVSNDMEKPNIKLNIRNIDKFKTGIQGIKSFTSRIASNMVDDVNEKFCEISNLENKIANKNIGSTKKEIKRTGKNYDPHMDVPEIDYIYN